MKNLLVMILIPASAIALVSFWAGRSLTISTYEDKIAQLENKVADLEELTAASSVQSARQNSKGAQNHTQPELLPPSEPTLSGSVSAPADNREAGNRRRDNETTSGSPQARTTETTSVGSAAPTASQTVPVVSEATTFAGRSLDVPALTDRHCEFATINSDTQMTRSLIWNVERGAVIMGNVPEGTIVEILSSHLERWVDYPGEHGLLVRIARTTLREMENQAGYVELRRINHKRCNIGAEFEM